MANSNEALADAVSGAVGTLVSLWCFYPIERIKTNLQAGKSLSTSLLSGSFSEIGTHRKDPDVIQNQIKKYSDLIQQLYRGCLTKSMHATSSSFCYFYFYSWILSYHNNKRLLRIQRSGNKLEPLRPSTRLVLSAIAAMLNTVVTLPLDVLSSKRTVESDGDSMDTGVIDSASEIKALNDNKKKMDDVWKSIEQSREKSPPGLSTSTGSSSSSSSSTIEMEFHEACSRSEELFSLHNENEDNDNNTSIVSSSTTSSTSSVLSNNEEYKLRWKERLEQRKALRLRRKRQLEQNGYRREEFSHKSAFSDINNTIMPSLAPSTLINADYIITSSRRWSKLWKGLAPALLLCSNPSIHYTVFDMVKSKIQSWKRQRNSRRSQYYVQLSVSEAFLVGLLSKFVATIVTYPLIRAKVLMMVRGDPTSIIEPSSLSTTANSSPSLWFVLKQSYCRDGGISGLYKGCDWQLVHTLLKSALMMAIREQITDRFRALFGVDSK